jgi:hypothetical protein
LLDNGIDVKIGKLLPSRFSFPVSRFLIVDTILSRVSTDWQTSERSDLRREKGYPAESVVR